MRRAQFQLHAEIEERHWWFVARRRILRHLVDHLLAPWTPMPGDQESREPIDSAPLVIDVGCGTGANIAALADRYRCIGIDTSIDAIDLARRRFPKVEFKVGFAPEGLGAAIGQADLVMMTDVLEHVPDDFALLSRILAAVKPGAHLLLTVPADLRLWSQHDVSFGHYRRYDAARFAMIWQDLPVSTRLLSHYNSRLYPLVKCARAIARRRGRSLGQAGTDFSVPMAPFNHLLTTTMAGEAARLTRVIEGRSKAYTRGVSLIAVLRRERGELAERGKPACAGEDFFDPQNGESVFQAAEIAATC